MRVMLLSAGRGERLAPLTDTLPKPLIAVGGEPLLLRHIRRFAAAGFNPIIINLHHLPAMIKDAVGDGSAFGVQVSYSEETQLLGAAGGIRLAMARGLLPEAFAVANGDIICDYDVQRLRQVTCRGAHLIVVPNPPAKPAGDFSLHNGQLLAKDSRHPAYTYAGLGVYDPALFAPLAAGQPHELLPILQQAIAGNQAGGEVHHGDWDDIGTPAALAAARRRWGDSD